MRTTLNNWQQLGDHIPGAIQDFYKAWKDTTGKTTASFKDFEKAVKDGDVQLEKLAPALTTIWSAAAETEAFANALQQPEKALQRLKSTMDKCMISFMGTVDSGDGVTSVAEAISYAFGDLRNALGEVDWKAFGEDVGDFLYDLQYEFWRLWYSTLKPLGEKLMEFGKWIGDTFHVNLAEAIIWVLKFKAVVTALSILGSVAKSGWEFYKMAKAFIGLMNTSGVDVPIGNGGNKGGKGLGLPGWFGFLRVLPQVAFLENVMENWEPAQQKYRQEHPEGSVDLTSARNWIPKPLVDWYDSAAATPGKLPTWLGGIPWRPTPTINASQAMPMPQMNPVFLQQAGVNPSLSIRTDGELKGEIDVKVTVDDTYVDQKINAKIHDYDTQILNMIGVGSY